ncbi:MAG: diphosphomevalonate decarboxylase, partial [Thermoplasmata archaeon]
MDAPAARAATFEASPNIALVKYWGMRDAALGLPYNGSISLTLDRLRTRTTVRFDPRLAEDRVILNGSPAEGRPRDDVVAFL